MLYIAITLFFGSLIGIILMVGRRLYLIDSGQMFLEESMSEEEYLEELKDWSRTTVRRTGFVALVIAIKLYVKGLRFLKIAYVEIMELVKEIREKGKPDNGNTVSPEQQEPNKVLKRIGEFRRKIKRIKQKVARDEKKS